MKKFLKATTLDFLLQTYGFLLLDSNSLIFHFPQKVHQKLNSDEISLEAKKKLVQPYSSIIENFYEEWFRLLKRYSHLYVTNDVLDLELSEHRFLTPKEKKRYHHKYKKRTLPKGSLIRPYDSIEISEKKWVFLQWLDENCRINRKNKTKKPGLRKVLQEFLELHLREDYSNRNPSRIDQEVLVNGLVFGLLKKKMGVVLTNDLLLSNTLLSFQDFLTQNSLSMMKKLRNLPLPFQTDLEKIKKFQLFCYCWERAPQKENLLVYPREKIILLR